MPTLTAPTAETLRTLRWRNWEAAARRLGYDDERVIRRLVALRWWLETRRPEADRR